MIEQYNPEWKIEYEKIAQILQVTLGDLAIAIQHVGSTSIVGMLAKPIIDIDIIIEDKEILKEIASRLEKLGYQNRGEQGVEGRFAFRQRMDFESMITPLRKRQLHHLYVCYSDSLALKNHLLFRDALMNDENLKAQYAQLKRALIEDENLSRSEYAKQKTAFILSVLAKMGLTESELNSIKQSNT